MPLPLSLRLTLGFITAASLAALGASGGCSADNTGGAGPGGAGGGGAGGPMGKCVGTPPSCLGLMDFDCQVTAGCMYAGSCQGTSQLCDSIGDPGTCGHQKGCTWQPVSNCAGNPNPCFNFFSQAQCNAQKGCTWNVNQFQCAGSPTPCLSIPAGMCTQQQGCILNNSEACLGTHAACPSLTLSKQCNDNLGCTWVSSCTGAPTPCESLSLTDCAYQPGCTCEGCSMSSSSSSSGGGPCVHAEDCAPTIDPCFTGDCINGECVRVPNCKPCVKQIDCNPASDFCLTGNCINLQCEAIPNCRTCVTQSDCASAQNPCFTNNCINGTCETKNTCVNGDNCCPDGCAGFDSDCANP